MISLVTTCMNREAHLRRCLPGWLALPEVSEIVITDWSTREPFFDLLDLDVRVRILRVEAEPRWVQTYPTNLAIAHATHELILKCDADCLPAASVTALHPAPGRFYAGDWRTGKPLGKACVNGQCFFTKTQWQETNGYSELFRRYSRDDVDFYDRLISAGHARHEIPAAQLDFLPHDDAARISNQTPPHAPHDSEAILHQQLDYHESINRVLAAYLPWGLWYPQAHYDVVAREHAGRLLRLRRDLTREIPLSAPLQQLARSHAIRTVAARLGRLTPLALSRLDEAACLHLIARHATVPVAHAA